MKQYNRQWNYHFTPNSNFLWKLKKSLLLLIISAFFVSCNCGKKDSSEDRKQIIAMLDSWNNAAAKADYQNYFNCFAEDAVFIGTDASEHWDKKSFMIWAKPHFDKRKTWDFKSIERHIYFNAKGDIAWFDELLNTQMKICRGSGVLIKQENAWKIQQYVLSMCIPNQLTDTVVKLKTLLEDEVINKLTQK